MKKKYSQGQIKWLKAGLEILGEQGVESVTIDSLGKALNRSKGSFYHHFKDRDVFLNELVSFWESSMTDWVIDMTQAETGGPEKQLQRLAELTSSAAAMPIEREIRQWSRKSPAVNKVLKRVEKKRCNYLEQLLKQVNVDDPRLLSRTIYALFVGAQFLAPPATKKEMMKMYGQIIAVKSTKF